MFWSPATGAHTVSGPVLAAFEATGSENGALGYPVQEPQDVAGGTVQRFQGGTLTYVAAEDRVEVG